MLEKNFERKWLTIDEELAALHNKKNKNQLTEHDKERMRELELRQEDTRMIKEFSESEKHGRKQAKPHDDDPHLRNPGQEGYF